MGKPWFTPFFARFRRGMEWNVEDYAESAPKLVNYLRREWVVSSCHTEVFDCFFTNVMHFGHTSTSTNEGAHAVLVPTRERSRNSSLFTKKFLQQSNGCHLEVGDCKPPFSLILLKHTTTRGRLRYPLLYLRICYGTDGNGVRVCMLPQNGVLCRCSNN